MATRRRFDDRELIAAILERIGGKFEPRKVSAWLEADGLALEFTGTITRSPPDEERRKLRAAAMAELEEAPHRALRCECSLARPRRGSFSKFAPQCDQTTVVAVVVERGASGAWFRFVCGRHEAAHGVAPADLLAVIILDARALEERRSQARAIAVERERQFRAEEAAAEKTILTVACPRCHAVPGVQCSDGGPPRGLAHGDRLAELHAGLRRQGRPS